MPVIQRFSNLDFDRWDALKDAIAELINTGIYNTLVEIHEGMVTDPDGFRYSQHLMHGSMSGPLGYRRFLPWHRAYLITFERELRRIDTSLSIPYWDWNVDGGELFGFPDPTDARFSEGTWSRSLGTRQSEESVEGRVSWFSDEIGIRRLLFLENYYDFARSLERGPHNAGHNWVGGSMSRMSSPRDPAFWFHHAQVDRIWALWQARYENRSKSAHLSGREAQLDPWGDEFTVESVNDISNLGEDSYEYVEPIHL